MEISSSHWMVALVCICTGLLGGIGFLLYMLVFQEDRWVFRVLFQPKRWPQRWKGFHQLAVNPLLELYCERLESDVHRQVRIDLCGNRQGAGWMQGGGV